MAKRTGGTRRASRKGLGKSRKMNRKHVTRRMKRGGGLFSKNSAVAPRSSLRLGSILSKTIASSYVNNKDYIKTLLDNIDEGIHEGLRKVFPDVSEDKLGNPQSYKDQLTPQKVQELKSQRIDISLDGMESPQKYDEVVRVILDVIRLYRDDPTLKEKIKNKISSLLAGKADKQTAGKMQEALGIKGKSPEQLLGLLKQNQLTVVQAAALKQMIEKIHSDLKAVIEQESGMKLNNIQSGGKIDWASVIINIVVFLILSAFISPIGAAVVMVAYYSFMESKP